MTKEITFSNDQKQIIKKLQDQKKALQTEMNTRLNQILERENDVLILICDAAGVKPVNGIELKEDSMVVPVEEDKVKKTK